MTAAMNAITIEKYHGSLVFCQRPVPTVRPHEVLIRVTASGLCSTDLHLLQGRMDLGLLPRVLGHEIAGEIAHLGAEVANWQVGQRVAVSIDVSCGECFHCLTGKTQQCPHKKRIGFELDGGHADYVAVPATNLVLLPDEVNDEAAAILPDAVACMYHALFTQGQVGVGQRVIILGAGGLGIHGVQLARLAGAEVLATSRRKRRLQAAETFGAHGVNPNVQDLEQAVLEFSSGDGADVVADCIGTEQSVQQGLTLLRPGGKLLVIAYLDEWFKLPSIPLFSTEKQVIGCRGSTRQELKHVVALVARGALEPVIGARYMLAQVDEAVAALEHGDLVGRIVFTR